MQHSTKPWVHICHNSFSNFHNSLLSYNKLKSLSTCQGTPMHGFLGHLVTMAVDWKVRKNRAWLADYSRTRSQGLMNLNRSTCNWACKTSSSWAISWLVFSCFQCTTSNTFLDTKTQPKNIKLHFWKYGCQHYIHLILTWTKLLGLKFIQTVKVYWTCVQIKSSLLRELSTCIDQVCYMLVSFFKRNRNAYNW